MIMTRARRAELGFELVVTGADGAVDGLGGAFEEGAEVVEVVLVVVGLDEEVEFEKPEREAELRKFLTMSMAWTPLDILIEMSTANRP